ncbi:MAG: V-type ATP synthase subunit D [bacterium]
MEQVSPTRMNLLAKKSQIKLAKQGVDLLKKKRDALVQEFFEIVKVLVKARKELEEHLHGAYKTLMLTKAIEGKKQLESIAGATKRDLMVDITEKSVWGVLVPEITRGEVKRSLLERGYGIGGVGSRIDRTAEEFENILDLILEVSTVETHLRRMGQEIKKTTRRVNALEQNLVPKLNVQVKFIKNTLEERAREDIFRLKRIKNS